MDYSIAIAGIAVDNIIRGEAVRRIRRLAQEGGKHTVCFVNAEAVVLARHNKLYLNALLDASLRLVDGVGMDWAARLRGKRFADNCNGTDLFPLLCSMMAREKMRVFLLGGRPHTALKTAQWMLNEYPGLEIAGTAPGYLSKEDTLQVLAQMTEAKPDILLVGMGSPLQELWIASHLEAIPAGVSIGVGGLFDFYSQSITRAPLSIRKNGLEWVWRIARDPKRWPRLLRLFEFIYINLIS